jgi:hypothetical protein
MVEKIHLFFLAGETERVFAITDWDTRMSFITDLEILTLSDMDLTTGPQLL